MSWPGTWIILRSRPHGHCDASNDRQNDRQWNPKEKLWKRNVSTTPTRPTIAWEKRRRLARRWPTGWWRFRWVRYVCPDRLPLTSCASAVVFSSSACFSVDPPVVWAVRLPLGMLLSWAGFRVIPQVLSRSRYLLASPISGWRMACSPLLPAFWASGLSVPPPTLP